ncbi:MAG: putative DNA binding domain-containing protein [Planctomycetota bacterium]|nr:putative DNA binding domain-containing protein [Planctomycetota bacterium]
MTPDELRAKLDELLALPAETEWVEFKEAKTGYDLEKLGEYFSALSNEANLKGKPQGWLVFGVTNLPPRRIVGTTFKNSRTALDALKKTVADQTSGRLTFVEIHELAHPNGRVLLFEIPAALRGQPTSWKGHYYGRDGESLGPLNLEELERIRGQAVREDWSIQTVAGATLADLDPQALAFARTQYKEKHPPHAAEVDGWDDATFLNKAKVCVNGAVTRAALLLLGKAEAAPKLSPAQARITWVLRDEHGQDKDYRHFDPPLILASDQVLAAIRNLTVRQLPSGTLFPHELTQYDPWVIRETLHNCIAHQDYAQGGRINVVETPESLLFTNRGSFLPGSVEAMIQRDAPPDVYRNAFLAQAMVNLNMIDTIGSGIKRMFNRQRERSFPMPDYDLTDPGQVAVRLTGHVLDENYTRLLLSDADLTLMDVIALDKVQKRIAVDDETLKRLRSRKLVEGRKFNVFVSSRIAIATDTKAEYIKNRGLDKEHYKALVISYLEKFGPSKREDLDKFLREKLPDALSLEQKTNRIRNLFQEMRRKGVLDCEGRGPGAVWVLAGQQGNLGVS